MTDEAPTKPVITDVQLCDEQQAAYDEIAKGDYQFYVLTGKAGSGKSEVVKKLRRNMGAAICATTGMAAMNVGGTTVDSLFSIDRMRWKYFSESILDFKMTQSPDLVIIDEASAIGFNMGNLIYSAAVKYEKKIVLVGDWAQTAQVKDEALIKSDLLKEYKLLTLQKCHRQSDANFLKALNECRLNCVSPESEDLFRSRIVPRPPDEDNCLRMIATNDMTSKYNQYRLWTHIKDTRHPPFVLKSEFKDERHGNKQRQYPRNQKYVEKAIEDSRLADGETFAVGCRVLFTVNFPASGYVNGDTGTIVGGLSTGGRPLEEYQGKDEVFQVNRLKVLLDRTGAEIEVMEINRTAGEHDGSLNYSVKGFPLALGYACTIHKSQGMTVQRAWVSLASILKFPPGSARHGLAYVGLSRTRSLEGLMIDEWRPSALATNPEMLPLVH